MMVAFCSLERHALVPVQNIPQQARSNYAMYRQAHSQGQTQVHPQSAGVPHAYNHASAAVDSMRNMHISHNNVGGNRLGH